jgi:beta-mannosidase
VELHRRTFDVNLAPNRSTEVWKGTVPGEFNVTIRPYTTGQPVRTSQADVPRPIGYRVGPFCDLEVVLWKDEVLPWLGPVGVTRQDLALIIEQAGLDSVTLSTNEPIKGIVLDAEGDDCEWDDQAIDLFPGPRYCAVSGCPKCMVRKPTLATIFLPPKPLTPATRGEGRVPCDVRPTFGK